jgi:lon-related putative ATP-dependent protease
MSKRPRELAAKELWNTCEPSQFDFESTKSLPEKISIIGQQRAVQAIDFGMGIASHGFNVYALGSTGTGRTTTIRTFLDRIAAAEPVPNDWIYVNNFADPNQPNAVALPPGTAVDFRHDMQELVSDLLREIPRAFESEDYEKQKEKIVREMQEQRNEQFTGLEHKVNERGFTLLKTAMGLGIAPVLNGQVLTPEAYQRLDENTQQDIEKRQQTLQSEMAETMRSIRDLEKTTKRQLQDFDREIAGFAVGHLIEELRQKYGHLEELPEYLKAIQADIVDNVQGFKGMEEEAAEGLAAAMQASQRESLLKRYTVNIIVDNSQQRGSPVVFEPNPTYGNLIGRIEHRSEFGALVTDFSMIKAGCLHRANGGYLVVEARGLLTNALAWDALKRSIKNRRIRSEEMGTQLQLISTVTLEPEPIPLNVKVLLIGDPMTYYLLHEYDEDFRKLFKVQADFGTYFDRTPESCGQYAQFVAARCHEEGLPFDSGAAARIVEYGSRLAGHQKKLSTRFGEIADLVREASYWAKHRGGAQTAAEDVQTAIDQNIYRSNRAEEQIQELLDEGTLRVDLEGEAVGQVNGLSVLTLGDYAFGRPSRITVRTYTGKTGVVSLEREAKLSGRIHDKGLLTLTGYLGGKYAIDAPLSLSASISFEQLYDEIEGDSASSTELYALLSSLSGLPLKQGIAVTGAVDQQGNVLPIGGANEKIEGFFDTCHNRGLTGEQGVLLPANNVVNLMLRADVRQAVEDGQFHIYPVRTVDEGIEILTGTAAGELQQDGTYPVASVHGRVMARLEEIDENLKAKDEKGEKGGPSSNESSDQQDGDSPEPDEPGENGGA